MSMPREAVLASAGASTPRWPQRIRSAAQESASAEANATTRRDADSAASRGMTTSQIAAKELDAAGRDRDRHHEARERQRRQHMRALIAAGARQEPGYEDRRDQPGEGTDFECARRTAERQVERKYCKGREAAEQPRRHEGAMPRARQRVVARRRMQQRIETIADDTQHSHGYSRFGLRRIRRAGTPPCHQSPCQSDIKRTLRRSREWQNT